MKFLSRADFVVFPVLIFASLFFARQYETTWHQPVTGGTVAGMIGTKNNKAEQKSKNHVVWREVSAGSSVYRDDTIRTLFGSSLVIRLEDKSELTMGSESIIILTRDDGASGISFLAGSIRIDRHDAAKPLAIRTSGGESIIMDRGSLSISGNRNGSTLEVEEGTVRVLSNAAERDCKKNSAVDFGSGAGNHQSAVDRISLLHSLHDEVIEKAPPSVLSSADSLPPVIVEPSGNQRFAREDAIAIHWESADAGREYGVTVSKKIAGFLTPVFSTVVKGSSVTVPKNACAPGEYICAIGVVSDVNGQVTSAGAQNEIGFSVQEPERKYELDAPAFISLKNGRASQ